MYWGYIKKEDAKNLGKAQRINSYIVIGAMAIVSVMMQFIIIPKLIEIAGVTGFPLPVYSQYYFPIAMSLLILMSISIIQSSDYLEDDLKQKLQKYKKGEMILLKKLWNKNYEYKVMGMMFVMIVYLTVSIIMPIYKITGMVY
ncbi:MAG: hypothetical protein HN981_00390 [Candidatus Pacebacteria bacterium]|jgi:hypothetical protein|nr:hypothetical protein [Candidatus Paceibacterota bacterium]MBT4651944.1 hypothetical protein [Candidatus Paceibacterota bacterium]MBT6755966.1 hypothetical protein [Candidatus Paceibacterota bacterium]MBT6920841.1 hypothetical protein [Candidatus Paceibacterota bacterium]